MRSTAQQRKWIEDAEQVFVSSVSIWEVAIKSALGRIDVDTVELAASIEARGFVELPVLARHAAGVAALPLHHHGPFDRLLVAQALAEPLRLLTADPVLVQTSDIVLHA